MTEPDAFRIRQDGLVVARTEGQLSLRAVMLNNVTDRQDGAAGLNVGAFRMVEVTMCPTCGAYACDWTRARKDVVAAIQAGRDEERDAVVAELEREAEAHPSTDWAVSLRAVVNFLQRFPTTESSGT